MNSQVLKFRKKPVVIDAVKWTGANLREIITFTSGSPDVSTAVASAKWADYCDLVESEGLIIKTLEGEHIATVGDWIIKGVKGECYPCKPDIFELTYEVATPAPIPDHLPDATKMVAPIPDAGEGVEVVGHILIGGVTDGEMDDNDLDFSSRMLEEIQARCVTPDPQSLPVMLVSQHTRIVSALQASAMVVPDGWIAVSDRLPEVPEGEEQEVIVCVKRAHNGESYVFSARYLNAFLLYNDDIDDESTTATGWHDVKEHSEYDGWYSKLIDDGSGDEVTHWMPLEAPPAPGDSK